jgi:nucleoside-diphosphate-sugar epimerase
MQNLVSSATGRSGSLFSADLQAHESEIGEILRGRSILVIGGAGSIGSSTIAQVLRFQPGKLHVVDQNENNLAELVRELRSSPGQLSTCDFRTFPIDFGSSVMGRLLDELPPYEIVLNFAALKHVRSEKDVYSLLQMLNTNVVKVARLIQWLRQRGGTRWFFSVSTDKAANPVNLMGASKRLMEHVMFSGEFCALTGLHVTSARFANVAFSDGSLLHSFLKRIEKRQPIAVPRSTRRFFVSIEEAGQICLLAAFCAPTEFIMIPRFSQQKDLQDLESVAAAVLAQYGLEPRFYADEAEAGDHMAADLLHRKYPVLLTPLDTTGEKSFEEFVAADEDALELGYRQLLGVPYVPVMPGVTSEIVTYLESILSRVEPEIAKQDIVDAVSAVLHELRHVETGKNLDQRM